MWKIFNYIVGFVVLFPLYFGNITAQAVPVLSAKLYSVTVNPEQGPFGPTGLLVNQLVEIDLLTLNSSVVGTLGIAGTTGFASFGGMAYDSNSQTMYMVGGRNNNNLFTLDLNTGSATLIGNHGVNDLFGLAFDTRNNVLYGTQNDFGGASGFFSLNTSTGAATTIAANIADPDRGIDGLAYDRDLDQLVGLESGGGPTVGGEVFEINRSTGATTSLTPPTQPRLRINNNGFAYDFINQTFWAVDVGGNLFSYDRGNGFGQQFVRGGLGQLSALTFVGTEPPLSVVPLPPSLALFAGGLGLMGMVNWRRRRKSASR